MARRITVDPDEWKRIKRDVESLKNDRREQTQNEYVKNLTVGDDLNDRERRVTEYIESHPGCSKERVVKQLVSIGAQGLSRNPTFRIIKSLIESKYLIEKRDRHNRNTHMLYVNKDHIPTRLDEQFAVVEDNIQILLDTLSEAIHDLRATSDPKTQHLKQRHINSLLRAIREINNAILFHFFNLIFTWLPQELPDRQMVLQIHRSFVQRILTITFNFTQFLLHISAVDGNNNGIDPVDFHLKIPAIGSVIKQSDIDFLKSYDLGVEIDEVLKSVHEVDMIIRDKGK